MPLVWPGRGVAFSAVDFWSGIAMVHGRRLAQLRSADAPEPRMIFGNLNHHHACSRSPLPAAHCLLPTIFPSPPRESLPQIPSKNRGPKAGGKSEGISPSAEGKSPSRPVSRPCPGRSPGAVAAGLPTVPLPHPANGHLLPTAACRTCPTYISFPQAIVRRRVIKNRSSKGRIVCGDVSHRS